MYSSLFLWIAGTYQLFGIVLVTNVLASKVLSRKDMILVTVIMTIGGSLLLKSVQYFAEIYTIGVLILFLSWKGVQWVKSFIFVIVGQILFILSDYLIGVFAGTALGVYSGDYHTTLLDAWFIMVIFVTPCLIVAYTFSLCVSWILRRGSFKNAVKYNEFMIISLLILTIAIMYFLIYLEDTLGLPIEVAELYIIIFATLILAIGIVFTIAAKVEKTRAEQMKREQEVAQLRDYTEKLEMLNDEMSVFKHDYINILASLHGYIVARDKERLEAYFKTTIHPLIKKS